MADDADAVEQAPTADTTPPDGGVADPAAPPEPVSSQPDEKPSSALLGGEQQQQEDTDEPSGQDAADDPVAPETYELTLPDENPLGETGVANIEALAREFDLSNDEAQKLVDLQLGAVQAVTEAAQAAYVKQGDTWHQEITADTEFGGEHLKATLDDANRVLKEFADGEFVDELKDTPYANHPGLVRMLARVGKLMREGNYVPGDQAPSEQSMEQRWYSQA